MMIWMELEGEINGPKDKYVMEKVKEIADTIHPSTKTTCDYRSKYEDKKLPLVDVKMWMGDSTNGQQKVLHEHYMKDVSS